MLELENPVATIAALERRLALKRASLAALARFADGVTENVPLEVVLRDQLHSSREALGLSGGNVILESAAGAAVTWVFGECGVEGVARRTAATPIVWQGRRLGVLVLTVPDGEALEDAKESGEALAAQIAQTVALFEAFGHIRRQEERYRRIFDSALVGLYQSTPDGFCLAANATAARNLGFESPEALMQAMNSRGYSAYADPGVRAEIVRRLATEDVVENVEIEAVRQDGSHVWLLQSAQAVRDEAGRVTRIDGIVQNIDERKRAEGALAATRRRLEDVLSTSPAMSFVLSFEPDGSVRPLWVSESARQLTGYSAAESCSFEWWSANVHPDDAPTVFAQMEALQRTGGVLQEYRFRHRDGVYRWIRDEEKVARRHEDGSLEVVGCWIDITEQKKAEEARSQSVRLYRAMVQNTTIGIGRCDADWRIVQVNPALARMLGYSEDELIGRSFAEVTHPDDVPIGRALWGEVQRGQRDHFQVEKRYIRKDGGVVWVNLTLSAVRDAHGQVEFGMGVIQDITERKKAESDLEHRRQVLSQAEKMADMGALLAGVAHELNNPLSVVVGQAQLIVRAAGDGPLAVRARSLDQAADRCARIVHNFLSLARQRPPERARVSLNDVIREALELIAYPLRVDGVELVLELAADLPALWADPHQLHQVIVNLVTNAQHAMEGGDGPRRVTVTSGLHPVSGVRLRIADSGPGIPDAIRDQVFEPFFTTKPQGQGTGLGLPLCRGILETHGGRLSLEPYATGSGAVFVLDLPLDSHPETAGNAAREESPKVPATKRSILVVDDEVGVAAVLEEFLTAEGHAVDVAGGGAEGIARLVEKDYDLVITDMKMPGLGGPAVFSAAGTTGRRMPAFVFMTGDALTPETSMFLAKPGRILLEKPFRAETVRKVLAGLFADEGLVEGQ